MSIDYSTLECIVDVGSNQDFPPEFASLPLASQAQSEDILSVFGSGSALDSADLSSFCSDASSVAALPQLRWEEEDTIMAESTIIGLSSLEALTSEVKYNSEQQEWLRCFEEQQQRQSQSQHDIVVPSAAPIKHEPIVQEQQELENEEEDNDEPNYETDDEEDATERRILAAVNKEKPSRDEFGQNVAREYRKYLPDLVAGTKTHSEVAKLLGEALPLWRRRFNGDFMTKIYRGKILKKYIGPVQAPHRRTKASVTGDNYKKVDRDGTKREKIKNHWIKSGRSITPANLAKETGISRPVAHRLITEFKEDEENEQQ